MIGKFTGKTFLLKKANRKITIASYKLQVANYKLQVTSYKLQVESYRELYCGLRKVGMQNF